MNISGYQIGRKVSSKSFYTVYNALEDRTSNTVSVCLFNHANKTPAEFCYNFKLVSSQLLEKSFGIMAPVKKAGVTEDNCFVIIEYFSSSHRQADNIGEFDSAKVLDFGLQIASTLSRLHENGIVHGAVELSNLYFPDANRVVLGMVAFHRTLTDIVDTTDLTLDEWTYLAPEVPQDGVSPESDFYALGVVLYELLVKRKPFFADNIDELNLQKLFSKLDGADTRLEKLIPLFELLLHPNPKLRMNSAEQFQKSLQQCGYDIQLPEFKNVITSGNRFSDQSNSPPENIRQSTLKKPVMFITAAIMLVVVSILILVVFDDEEKAAKLTAIEKLERDQSQLNAEAHVTPKLSAQEINALNPNEDALIWFRKALKHRKDNNLASALINVNSALKENSKLDIALQLKNELEREIEARSMLEHAKRLLNAGKFVKPEGDNAFQIYQQLSVILGSNDDRVLNGYQRIAEFYLKQANFQFAQNNLNQAETLIRSGLGVISNYPPLISLQKKVAEQQSAAQLKARQLAEAKNLREEQELAAQQQLEIERANELKKQVIIQAREDQIELEKQAIQLKIKTILVQGRQILISDPNTLSSLDAASRLYYQAAIYEANNIETLKFREQILGSYSNLAFNKMSDTDYEAALNTVESGLRLNSEDDTLNQMKRELSAVMASSNNPQQPTPVTGSR